MIRILEMMTLGYGDLLNEVSTQLNNGEIDGDAYDTLRSRINNNYANAVETLVLTEMQRERTHL